MASRTSNVGNIITAHDVTAMLLLPTLLLPTLLLPTLLLPCCYCPEPVFKQILRLVSRLRMRRRPAIKARLSYRSCLLKVWVREQNIWLLYLETTCRLGMYSEPWREEQRLQEESAGNWRLSS